MTQTTEAVVVQTGLGNVASIINMLKKLRVGVFATADAGLIRNARRIILPGVGAFDAGMHRLRELGLIEPIREAAMDRRTPLLGVCLGMQLLGEASEEGEAPGLGLIPGRAVRIPVPAEEAVRCKLPHMGWNSLQIVRDGGLYAGEMREPRFYFVHSFHVIPRDPATVTATAKHGSTTVTASIQQGNIMGVQFHPEKSHRFGLWLMGNFLQLPPC